MYKLLIVDDELIITDGLVHMFEETDLNIQLYKAYNASQALRLVDKNRIDILLTDIRMPGMDGLKLQRLIKNINPQCQTIFLTGHNEFEYAQRAIRDGGNDFILKTEDDEVVINAIKNAIKKLDNIIHDEEVQKLNDSYINKSKPLLRERFWQNLLAGGVKPNKIDLKMMDIMLDIDRDVNIVIGLLCNKQHDDNIPAVLSLIQQYLNSKFTIEEYCQRQDVYIWFIQNKEDNNKWINDFGYLNSTLDSIQNMCSEKIYVDVKFILQSSPVKWEDIESICVSLSSTLRKSQMSINSGVMTDKYAEKFIKYHDVTTIHDVRKQLSILHMLPQWIEDGQYLKSTQCIQELFAMLEHGVDYAKSTEACMTVSLILLSYINDHDLSDVIDCKFSPEKIFTIISNTNLMLCKSYFIELIEILCNKYKNDIHGQTNRVIVHMQQYIISHIDGDLSLSKLSELVHLNPSYLSRLYKSHTGQSITDTINHHKLEQSKKLLSNSYLKINQIGIQLGFNNPAHFTRFFKKNTGKTPYEYRSNKKV